MIDQPPSTTSPANGPFSKSVLRRHRRRAAADVREAGFLVSLAAQGLSDRLQDVQRRFETALLFGSFNGIAAEVLSKSDRIGRLVEADSVDAMLPGAERPGFAMDEECLPLREACLDLFVSPLMFHWTNDLPGALIQVRRALRPDGLMISALLGGDSLNELRQSFLRAEGELAGGVSPRVAPMAHVRELGGLLLRAGYALPVADSDRLTVRYGDAFALLRDLKRMGLSNALPASGRTGLRRDVLQRMAQHYAEAFADSDGRIRATFEIVYLTGWAPDESQPKPLRPGSARTRLADALGTVEHPAGDPARRIEKPED